MYLNDEVTYVFADLPDLVPNVTVLYEETRLEDRSLLYLQCAMEEDCASKSAYVQKQKYKSKES